MRKQTVGAVEFKAPCLELIDQVAETENAIVITKRGKPVSRLAPVARKRRSVVPGPRLVRVGKRLVARPTVAALKLPRLDLLDLVREERDRWPW